jgi:nicotinamide mononucleotide (NMN) deamidase PncC
MSKQPSFEELVPDDPSTISEIQRKAPRKGYKLLALIDSKAEWADEKIPGSVDKYLQIATSESLTCGLIMSTLVDIPWAGYAKYGGFGVYDTDAKRVFNNVKVDNVYTHKCASEMAIGVLKNSNATIAIAVTGNAMPLNEHVDMIGEVFIGIAGYNIDGNIIYETTALNACKTGDDTLDKFRQTCFDWYDTIKTKKTWNPRQRTATVSKEIRYYTALKAYEQCINFINNYNPYVPDKILQRKKENNEKNVYDIHESIPAPRFDIDDPGICMEMEIEIKTGKPIQPIQCAIPVDGRKDGALYNSQTSISQLNVKDMLQKREDTPNALLFHPVKHSKSHSKTEEKIGIIQRHRSAISSRRSAVVHQSPSKRLRRLSPHRSSPHRSSPRPRGRSIGGKRRTRNNNRMNKRTIRSR